jgi:flagellar hook-basal body complex protein FliE
MSDPIGAAVSRFTQSLSSSGLGQGMSLPGANQGVGAGRLGGGDSAARQVPLADGPSFGDTLKKAINDVSAQQDKASDTLGAFLRGENVELHQVMAATEEAQISLQMLIEVRNKFTDAYKSLANMQG